MTTAPIQNSVSLATFPELVQQPDDILLQIFFRLSTVADWKSIALTCTRFHREIPKALIERLRNIETIALSELLAYRRFLVSHRVGLSFTGSTWLNLAAREHKLKVLVPASPSEDQRKILGELRKLDVELVEDRPWRGFRFISKWTLIP